MRFRPDYWICWDCSKQFEEADFFDGCDNCPWCRAILREKDRHRPEIEVALAAEEERIPRAAAGLLRKEIRAFLKARKAEAQKIGEDMCEVGGGHLFGAFGLDPESKRRVCLICGFCMKGPPPPIPTALGPLSFSPEKTPGVLP